MKCNNCNTEFKYFRLLKSFWFGYLNIKCEQCDSVFEHKYGNRLIGGLIIGGSILFSNLIFIEKTFMKTIIGFAIISLVLSLITPLIMKFNRVK